MRNHAVWVPAYAGTTIWRHTFALSRRLSPELCIVDCPPENTEGAGKAGWPLHPGPCAKEICASARTTGTGGDHTGLPCAMVYALYVISSVNQLLPPSSMRDLWGRATDLARAWARQDHTISSSAFVPLVGQHVRVHRIPCRDDRDTSLCNEAGWTDHTPNPKFGKQEYFCVQGLTALCGRCLTGKSRAPSELGAGCRDR